MQRPVIVNLDTFDVYYEDENITDQSTREINPSRLTTYSKAEFVILRIFGREIKQQMSIEVSTF